MIFLLLFCFENVKGQENNFFMWILLIEYSWAIFLLLFRFENVKGQENNFFEWILLSENSSMIFLLLFLLRGRERIEQ